MAPSSVSSLISLGGGGSCDGEGDGDTSVSTGAMVCIGLGDGESSPLEPVQPVVLSASSVHRLAAGSFHPLVYRLGCVDRTMCLNPLIVSLPWLVGYGSSRFVRVQVFIFVCGAAMGSTSLWRKSMFLGVDVSLTSPYIRKLLYIHHF